MITPITNRHFRIVNTDSLGAQPRDTNKRFSTGRRFKYGVVALTVVYTSFQPTLGCWQLNYRERTSLRR